MSILLAYVTLVCAAHDYILASSSELLDVLQSVSNGNLGGYGLYEFLTAVEITGSQR